MDAKEIIRELNSMPIFIACHPRLIMELKANEDVAKHAVFNEDRSIQIGATIFYPHKRST